MSGRFGLEGRVAVVTGALGNLGPVWSEGLLEAGATVVGLDLPTAAPNEAFICAREAWYTGSLTSASR